MPININEQTIRSITEKYVKSLTRDPAKIPDIRKVVSEAIYDAAPDRKVTPDDITAVLHKLSKKPIISDKIIVEAAKQVIEENANDDLIFSIQSYCKQLKKKFTSDDVQ